jgi:hypothetical protein
VSFEVIVGSDTETNAPRRLEAQYPKDLSRIAWIGGY